MISCTNIKDTDDEGKTDDNPSSTCSLEQERAGGSPRNETELRRWIAQNGPLSIGIDATVMQSYTGGISCPSFSTCPGWELDHGVLITGWGTDANGTDYWMVKNSWNTDWGEEGYYRICRGKTSDKGIERCGLNSACVAAHASF